MTLLMPALVVVNSAVSPVATLKYWKLKNRFPPESLPRFCVMAYIGAANAAADGPSVPSSLMPAGPAALLCGAFIARHSASMPHGRVT